MQNKGMNITNRHELTLFTTPSTQHTAHSSKLARIHHHHYVCRILPNASIHFTLDIE